MPIDKLQDLEDEKFTSLIVFKGAESNVRLMCMSVRVGPQATHKEVQ